MVAFAYGIIEVITGRASPLWWVGTVVFYLVFILALTVGYHRLFSHKAFECHSFWHWFFAIIGCVSLSASPIQWIAVHLAHHKYGDTENDPHETSWRYFLRHANPKLVWIAPCVKRLMRQPMYRFTHKYSGLLFWIAATLSLTVSWHFFIFCFAAPIGLVTFITGIHHMYAHSINGPKNYWPLEFILPIGGEWMHLNHHERPRFYDFASDSLHFDLGAIFIRLIRTR